MPKGQLSKEVRLQIAVTKFKRRAEKFEKAFEEAAHLQIIADDEDEIYRNMQQNREDKNP